VTPVSQPAREEAQTFGQLHAETYEAYKLGFLRWLKRTGKNEERGKGYADGTIRATHYRIDHAYRWKWDRDDEFTTDFTPDDADELRRFLFTRTDKDDGEVKKYQKALKRLLRYKNSNETGEYEWDPENIPNTDASQSHNYLKKHELTALYKASLDHASFPSYGDATPNERDHYKAVLAQRIGKPKDEIVPDDFADATSWKIPSILAVCCDTGLRPMEVGRATTGWVNLKDSELVIPMEEATKDKDNWECALSTQSVSALEKWLTERQVNETYHDTDALWLNRIGNPYNTRTLNHLFDKLIETAGIEPRNRHLTWYSIRRGVATVWANEEGVHNAQAQLRHKSIETTMKYVHSESSRRKKMADNKW
jgi:integrase